MSVAVVKFSIVESDLSRIYSDKVLSRWVVWYKSLFGTHTQSQTHRQVVNYVLDNDAAGFHLSVTDSMQSALQPLITRTLIAILHLIIQRQAHYRKKSVYIVAKARERQEGNSQLYYYY